MTTELLVSFEVDGLHFWPDAPSEYSEFGQPHRHLFKFICWKKVDVRSPQDRPIELWELRQNAITAVVNTFHIAMGSDKCDFQGMSCEGISDWLRVVMSFDKVFVGEEFWLGAMVSND